MRIWGKMWKANRLIRDITIENNDETLNRTRKVFQALEDICYEFDLAKPMWLDKNIEEFKRHDKTRFGKDNFIEGIEFDYLEIHVIEE